MATDGPLHTLDEAFEGIMSLLNPGPYGLAESDPKARLIRDLGALVDGLKTPPVIIGGIAVIVNGHARQTADVDLLVAREDAMTLIRRLEVSREFARLRLDRFRHHSTGAGLDVCVEGELTTPRHQDRFPSPRDVRRVARSPIDVVDLHDLLLLKAKSGRSQDEADFIALYKVRGLASPDVEAIKAKVQDSALRSPIDRWHARAIEEIERERLRKPPVLE
ncbi:MAG: hypothetical protein HYY17_01870 [Planctomycetes bacterium]|nr:hypothetical protein [Planctomycetota bacterium]